MTFMYTLEPLLGRVYVFRGIRAMERVLAVVRMEVFRVLLMQPIAFFDRHGPSELTNVLAVDLDTIRSCIFGCARLDSAAGWTVMVVRGLPGRDMRSTQDSEVSYPSTHPRKHLYWCIVSGVALHACNQQRHTCRNISRDRGLRAILEATGSIAVLFYLSWRLAPVLGTIIVSTGAAAALYRKATGGIEATLATTLRSLSRVAGQAFTNVRTVRSFAGENLERERFLQHVDVSHLAGVQFAAAKAWLEAANRGSIHLSLLILFGLGGWLVSSGHMPLRVMLTGIGFTYSLMYATQVRHLYCFLSTTSTAFSSSPPLPPQTRGSQPLLCT
jgi:ABC-type multidrug transport system fused ATPase/permease subunit